MGTTPGGLPYPEPTDFVTDGAAAIQALAEAIGGETGTLTATSPWTVVGSNGLRYAATRWSVTIAGRLSRASNVNGVGASSNLLTVPVPLRPPWGVDGLAYMMFNNDNDHAVFPLQLTTGGVLSMTRTNGSGAYLAGQALRFTLTYDRASS